MPTTRKQTAIAEGKIKPAEKKKRSTSSRKAEKYSADTAENDLKDDKVNLELNEKGENEPASKKLKMEETEGTKDVYKVGEYRNIDWCACC